MINGHFYYISDKYFQDFQDDKLMSNKEIANGIAIGANAVVCKDFFEEDITIAGVPAKQISNKGSKGLMNNYI